MILVYWLSFFIWSGKRWDNNKPGISWFLRAQYAHWAALYICFQNLYKWHADLFDSTAGALVFRSNLRDVIYNTYDASWWSPCGSSKWSEKCLRGNVFVPWTSKFHPFFIRNNRPSLGVAAWNPALSSLFLFFNVFYDRFSGVLLFVREKKRGDGEVSRLRPCEADSVRNFDMLRRDHDKVFGHPDILYYQLYTKSFTLYCQWQDAYIYEMLKDIIWRLSITPRSKGRELFTVDILQRDIQLRNVWKCQEMSPRWDELRPFQFYFCAFNAMIASMQSELFHCNQEDIAKSCWSRISSKKSSVRY